MRWHVRRVGEGASHPGTSAGLPPRGYNRNTSVSPVAAGSGLSGEQRALLAAEHANMLACIRCGQCLTSCPTYVLSMHEAEGPRGRVAMARALLEGQLELTPELIAHERNCLVCDACSAICPAGVQMDPLQVALRAAMDSSVTRPPWQRLMRGLVFRQVFSNMRVFRSIVRLLWLYQRFGVQRLARGLGILKLLRMEEMETLLPRVTEDFLVPRGERHPASDGSREPLGVSFFAGCIMSTAFAEIDRGTIRVLQRAGCDVENTAGQGCCGALNFHAGDLEGARRLAQRNIAAFEEDLGGPIVVNSAGCGAMLKEYAHHFRDDPTWAERARALSARVKDVTELLAGRELPMRRDLGVSVTYQEPCHLAHAQRIVQQPRALLRAIPGLELREMAESSLCCGSAGIYNLTNPVESRQLRDRKLDNALATGASVIVTANPGCLMQLQGGLARRGSDVPVKHIVELLDAATAE